MGNVKLSQLNNKIINEPSSITFLCPNCFKGEISRTRVERLRAKPYKCPNCGFIGP